MREAIFGVLGSLAGELGCDVAGSTVADLFAGSGAFGIEALSRGAAHVAFVDTDRLATQTIGDNLAELGFAGSRTTVVRTEALRWLRAAPATDLVLCDPPYAFDQWPALTDLLEGVAGVVVLESDAPRDLGSSWEILREKHYGGTVVTVARVTVARPAPAVVEDHSQPGKGDT